MNKLKKTLRRGVRRIFCGKSVSVAHKQKIDNTSLSTSPRLVVGGEKKNNTKRSLKMNRIKTLHQDKSFEVQAEKHERNGLAHEKTLVKDRVESVKGMFAGLARGFFSSGKSVSETLNRQVSNTSFNVSIHLVKRVEKKSKIRRKIEMNNMTQAFAERIRRRIGDGRSLVFSWINGERKFTDRTVNRWFGKRETGKQFTVPQTGRETCATESGKSSVGNEKTVLKWISNSINQSAKAVYEKSVGQTVDREFGKLQTKRQLPVPQTDRKVSVRKHENGLLGSSHLVNKSAVGLAGLSRLIGTLLLFTKRLIYLVKKALADLLNRFGLGKCGKRQTEFTVPHTDCELWTAKHGREDFANKRAIVSWIFGLTNLLRRCGKRETGSQFPASHTGREAQTAKCTKSDFTDVSWVGEERGSSKQKVKRRFGERQTKR